MSVLMSRRRPVDRSSRGRSGTATLIGSRSGCAEVRSGVHLDLRAQFLRNEAANTGVRAFVSAGRISSASFVECSGVINAVFRSAVLASVGWMIDFES